MRRSRFAYVVIIAILIGAVLYFWQPWRERQQSIDFSNVNEIMNASREKTGQINNYKYKTTIDVGTQIKVSLTSRVVANENKRQMIDFSWTAPKMTGTASIYAQDDSIFLYNPLKDKWELPSEEPQAGPLMNFFWKQISLVDPIENLLKTNKTGKGISEIKDSTEKINDTVCVEVIPNEEAMSEISKSLPPQLVGAELTDVKQLFWISKKDLLITKYAVRAKVSFFGIKTMEYRTESIPSEFNKTQINISKKLQEKINQTKTP